VQGRYQQRAAAQALGIGDGIHGDVDGLTGLDEGRHDGMDRHGRDVLELRSDGRGHYHAQLSQHVQQRLDGEGRLAGLVAGAVQADHQAISDELVGAHALHLRHVLDTFGMDEGGGQPKRQREAEPVEVTHDPILYSGANTELKNRVSQP
jgi:hypothetical protein